MSFEAIHPPLKISGEKTTASIQFYRIENRFGHRIVLAQGDDELILSTDDSIDGIWPAAPPIQDVHFEDRGSSQVLFGVGMAGKSHYSMSIESDLARQLNFEFACHVKERPEFLGTHYKCLAGSISNSLGQFLRCNSNSQFNSKSDPVDNDSRNDDAHLDAAMGEITHSQDGESLNFPTFQVAPTQSLNNIEIQTYQWGFSIRI